MELVLTARKDGKDKFHLVTSSHYLGRVGRRKTVEAPGAGYVGVGHDLADIPAPPTNRVEIVTDTNVTSAGRFYRLATPNAP